MIEENNNYSQSDNEIIPIIIEEEKIKLITNFFALKDIEISQEINDEYLAEIKARRAIISLDPIKEKKEKEENNNYSQSDNEIIPIIIEEEKIKLITNFFALKDIEISQEINDEYLAEPCLIQSSNEKRSIKRYCGITQNPEAKEYLIGNILLLAIWVFANLRLRVTCGVISYMVPEVLRGDNIQ
ncbi:hypothetical protein Glove_86g157 [Diversispora epigaea]|uniref:Uncharacterized protein n=1 Tax=Diversispora epigaea TaxID=1348612 RepID=A0A397JAC1_9GLOM|nr:hypothetical protein Glove_86g157 [Diversispora epigaea]